MAHDRPRLGAFRGLTMVLGKEHQILRCTDFDIRSLAPPTSRSPQLTNVPSFKTVFQLRPVPGVPNFFSISLAVNLDTPTPAG
jgi:hypothetical protein